MAFRDRIVKFFKRDNNEQITNKGKGHSLDDPSGNPVDVSVSNARVNGVRAALTLDQELMMRYADYEHMDDYPELTSSLDIISDDTTITDTLRNRTIWAESKDKILRDILDDCLHRRLRIEEDIWLYVRTLCKYGNLFSELIITEAGVVGMNALPVPTMRRLVDEKGNLIGFIQDLNGRFNIDKITYNDKTRMIKDLEEKGMIFFEPWEIVHWRLRSKYVRSLYGISTMDPARWVWKRLAMLEDTALLYKLTRSPGRYAFYVDTGDLPPSEARALIRDTRRSYKKKTFVNASGELEFRNNNLSPEDDMWIPTRGKDTTRVEVLSGPDWNVIEDIEYFRDKMFTALKIPRSYYGGDAEADNGLAQKDVRFARMCLRVQREFRNGIRQVLRTHLAAINIDPDTVEWNTRMTAPSSIFELQQIEVMNAQAGLIETLAEYFPKEWLLQRIFNLSKDDATMVVRSKTSENESDAFEAARVAAVIQDKYPEVDPGQLGMGGGDEGAPANESVNEALGNNIKELLKETRKTNSRMLKKVEGVGPAVKKVVKRELANKDTGEKRRREE